jgi:hypothetical protein
LDEDVEGTVVAENRPERDLEDDFIDGKIGIRLDGMDVFEDGRRREEGQPDAVVPHDRVDLLADLGEKDVPENDASSHESRGEGE